MLRKDLSKPGFAPPGLRPVSNPPKHTPLRGYTNLCPVHRAILRRLSSPGPKRTCRSCLHPRLGALRKCRRLCCVSDPRSGIRAFLPRSHGEHRGKTLCSPHPCEMNGKTTHVSLSTKCACSPRAGSPDRRRCIGVQSIDCGNGPRRRALPLHPLHPCGAPSGSR